MQVKHSEHLCRKTRITGVDSTKRVLRPLCLLLGLLLSGCTIATPFRGAPNAERDALEGTDEVVVSVTHITLTDDREARRIFWQQVKALSKEMEESRGFKGISLRRQLFGNEAWTLSAWEDEESLRAFVRSPAHREAMDLGAAAAANLRFARYRVPRSNLPIRWEEALAFLESENQAYNLK